jgi:hypothetical protein
MDRRAFLVGTMGAALLRQWSADVLAQVGAPPPSQSWDAGRLRHLLPTVDASRCLVKASFTEPLAAAPTLTVGSTRTVGRMTDTAGEHWQFRTDGLSPGRRYSLALLDASGSSLCEPWSLSTFPDAGSLPDRCRGVFFTCAGGTESDSLSRGNLPAAIRNRLLRRALSFEPDWAVANGDHVYWDLHSPRVPRERRNTARLDAFDRSADVFGSTNETVLKRVAGPQIMPVYGTDFRSTPVFFLQDDHDYFDNDEGMDEIVTFPPPWFQLQLARATQRLYYPEFLPDPTRPSGLPWGSVGQGAGVSESFGTVRFGRLAEVLLYDVRRTLTLAGPSAALIDGEVERWLIGRTASSDAIHVVHGPSNPPGWTAGKWGEWYPDVLADGGLTTSVAKPYWQAGWLAQHDRLMAAIAAAEHRIPLVVSGDLHAIASGRMLRAGSHDFQGNPITTVLAGPIGTGPGGWPSAFRGIGATPPSHIDLHADVEPIEQHGFTLVDFLRDRIVLRLFAWDVKSQSPEAIDGLEPFEILELGR